MYIKRLNIDIHELMFYRSLSTSKSSIIFYANEITNQPLFMELIFLLLENGLRNEAKDIIKISKKEDSLGKDSNGTVFWIISNFKSLTSAKDVESALINASKWVVSHNLTFEETVKQYEECYKNFNKEINALFNEIIENITNKKHFVSTSIIDDMN